MSKCKVGAGGYPQSSDESEVNTAFVFVFFHSYAVPCCATLAVGWRIGNWGVLGPGESCLFGLAEKGDWTKGGGLGDD